MVYSVAFSPGGRTLATVSAEGAVRLDDVLARRTRIAIEVPDRGREAAPHAAALMAAELGWGEPRMAAEICGYRRLVDAELAGQSQPDDLGAYQAVAAAADPVGFYRERRS